MKARLTRFCRDYDVLLGAVALTGAFVAFGNYHARVTALLIQAGSTRWEEWSTGWDIVRWVLVLLAFAAFGLQAWAGLYVKGKGDR